MKNKKVFKDVKQKIIVAAGRHPLFGNEIPYKVITTETVPNATIAKERAKELREIYKNTEGISVHYFSV